MGCKSNQYEGSIIEESLINAGFEKVNNLDEADYFILNSCTVTHKADNETLYFKKCKTRKQQYKNCSYWLCCTS